MSDIHQYDDIIDLPCPKSSKHPHMSMTDRAAQFSPFAALTGYGDRIDETARLTESKPELTDEEKQQINNAIIDISKNENVPVSIEYFEPDLYKNGGKIIYIESIAKLFDKNINSLIVDNGTEIEISNIIRLTIENGSYE